MSRLPRIALTLCLALLPTAGCGGDSTSPSEALITVSGPLNNRTGQPMPSNARVLIAWLVSSTSPDYSYVFGEGELSGNSFRITLHDTPPTEALNLGKIGVGVVVLTTDASLQTGSHLEDVDPANLLGATGRFAVIYQAPNAGATIDWAADFPTGYGVGEGVDRVDDFDAFRPVAPSTMELIVDDLSNIDFVNWS